MMRLTRTLTIAALICCPALAAVFSRPEPFHQQLNFEPNGTLTIENPNGSILVTGTDSASLVVDGTRQVVAADAEGVRAGQKQTVIEFAGDASSRIVRTHGAGGGPTFPWKSTVAYNIRVPRSANLTIVNYSGESLQVRNILGNVYIRHVNGPIELTDVSGSVMIDTVNGRVRVSYSAAPRNNARITSINGPIEVSVPEQSSLTWLAQTVRGEIFSSLPLRGRFLPDVPGRAYQGTLNRGGDPKLVITSVMNRTYLLGNGQAIQSARVIQTPQGQPRETLRPRLAPQADVKAVIQMVTQRLLLQPPNASSFVLQLPRVDGNLNFSTSLGNIFVGELTGNARVFTRAGEITLGRVLGSCFTQSGGGSLNLGEISGPLTARTKAGNVLVKGARGGGTVSTEAGNIQVLYSAGGLLSLYSGGGDVTIRQAASPVRAESHSGDIFINVDPTAGSQPMEARSTGGNIVLNLSPGFGATIEATALTPIGMTPFQSDFAGLEITTEKTGNMLRTRASGRINGGGERIVLHVENGTIILRSRVISLPASQ